MNIEPTNTAPEEPPKPKQNKINSYYIDPPAEKSEPAPLNPLQTAPSAPTPEMQMMFQRMMMQQMMSNPQMMNNPQMINNPQMANISMLQMPMFPMPGSQEKPDPSDPYGSIPLNHSPPVNQYNTQSNANNNPFKKTGGAYQTSMGKDQFNFLDL